MGILGFFKRADSTKKSITADELEGALLEADIPYELVEQLLDRVGSKVAPRELEVALSSLLRGESYYDRPELKEVAARPETYLIIGVNGAGKTTTIAKLAYMFKEAGKSVMLGAGDTFRAAAITQLKLWGEKLGVLVVSSQLGHDPSAVCFDTIKSAKAKDIDVCIIDTAGRLHNNANLKNELIKIKNTCAKALGSEDFYRLLIIDGSQGALSVNQAKLFSEAVNIDGVIITKLDGSAKGGALFGIIAALRIPVLYIGTGEGERDFAPFSIDTFIDELVGSIYGA